MFDVRDGYYGENAVRLAEQAERPGVPLVKVGKYTALAQVYATLELAVQTNRLRS